MAFDLRAFREAHRPWAFTTADGRTFEALHVSAPVVQRYEDRVSAAKGDQRQMLAAIRWLLRHAFPWRFSYLLRGDPVKLVLALEPAARNEALADFFACLRGKLPNLPQRQKTNGTRSSAPIPIRSA